MVKSIKSVATPAMTAESFVLNAIDAAKGEGKKGITSWKLNPLFREYFGDGADPIVTTTQMRKAGTIAVFLQKGGASFYLRADLKDSTLKRHDEGWMERDAEVRNKTEKKPPESGDFLKKILRGSK